MKVTKEALERLEATCAEKDYATALLEVRLMMLALAPGDPVLMLRVGDKLREIGRIAEAERLLLRVRGLSPEKQWYWHASLGRLYGESGRFAEAEAQFREACEAEGDLTAPWVLLGALLNAQGRHSEALAVFEKGLKAAGDVDEVLVNMGHTFRALRRYAEAIDCYERALAYSPSESAVVRDLADVKEAQRLVQAFEEEGGEDSG